MSPVAYGEVADKLRLAGYDHAILAAIQALDADGICAALPHQDTHAEHQPTR